MSNGRTPISVPGSTFSFTTFSCASCGSRNSPRRSSSFLGDSALWTSFGRCSIGAPSTGANTICSSLPTAWTRRSTASAAVSKSFTCRTRCFTSRLALRRPLIHAAMRLALHGCEDQAVRSGATSMWSLLTRAPLAGHRNRFLREHSLKASLFVAVVHQHHGSNMQSPAAGLAGGHFTLRVLQETVGEVIFRPRPAGRFHSLAATVRTDKFDHIFLRIPIQSRPTRISNSYDVFGMRMIVHSQSPRVWLMTNV